MPRVIWFYFSLSFIVNSSELSTIGEELRSMLMISVVTVWMHFSKL